MERMSLMPLDIFDPIYEEETRFRETVGHDLFRRLALCCGYYPNKDASLTASDASQNASFNTYLSRGANGYSVSETGLLIPNASSFFFSMTGQAIRLHKVSHAGDWRLFAETKIESETVGTTGFGMCNAFGLSPGQALWFARIEAR
jgi:hypothetical protein